MLIKKQIKPVKMTCDIHGKVNFISVIGHKENVIGHVCEKCSDKPSKRNCKIHGLSIFYLNKDNVFCCKRCDVSNKNLICKYHGLTEFSMNNKGIPICKKCRAFNTAEYRRKLKEKAVKLFGGKCTKCGYDKCIAALDFHHVDKTNKEFNIFEKGKTAWKKIIEELKKCILLCSNCHREHHWNEWEEQRKNKERQPVYLNEWKEQIKERDKIKEEKRKIQKFNINIDLIRKLREP